jgi:hypothetical protein
MIRLYFLACKRWGPDRMTISAWAWVYARETGDTFYRDRIDGLILLLTGGRNHCQAAFQRQQRVHTATD